MKVQIVDYDPQWPRAFSEEEVRLNTALEGSGQTIEHIGSTAVPALAAKPIIDIMIGLRSFESADPLVPSICKLGYTYVPQHEEVMPYRRFFKRLSQERATHHINMVRQGGQFWNRHLLFRDYLRTHTDVAMQYADLKKSLAQRDWKDGNEYASPKGAFIDEALRQASGRDLAAEPETD